MAKRRSRGDGGLHWDENRQRWIATLTVGYDGRGKRITRKASGKTKTDAKDKLKELLRDRDDGLAVPADGYTVADAVRNWLAYGLAGRGSATVDNYSILASKHIIPLSVCGSYGSFRPMMSIGGWSANRRRSVLGRFAFCIHCSREP
jgi:hypothetical protein